MKPRQITANNETIKIIWDDDKLTQIKITTLRFLCPCAACISQREKIGDHYLALYKSEQIKLEKISDVGNYAIKFEWRDGHNAGFYEYSYLYNISISTTV